MHELSLAQELVETGLRTCRAQALTRVVALEVELECLCPLVPETLQSWFGELASGTALAGARLDIQVRPAWVECPRCGRVEIELPVREDCPNCRAAVIRAGAGSGCRLVSLEVDDEDSGT